MEFNLDQVKIRTATIDDLDTLYVFEQGVIDAERPFDPTLKLEPTYYYDLPAMITSGNIELVVAEINSKIIASGYARIEQSKWYLQHEQHAYLGFMYVHPDYRGLAINKKIIEALKSWAALQKITELRLEVYHGNNAAIRAYEKLGFQKHMVEMRLNTSE
jgi:ribosomal protein S18 acetylase RimI-like enzyme